MPHQADTNTGATGQRAAVKVTFARFLTGPNLYHDDSVLVITSDLSACPDLLGPGSAPVGPEVSAQTADPPLSDPLMALRAIWRATGGTRRRPLERALAMALAFQHRRTVLPARLAHVLEVNAPAVTVVLQCETPAIGLAAWQLATASAAWFLSPQGAATDTTSPVQALAHQFEDFGRLADSEGLDPLTLGLLRAAHARDIPWFRLAYPQQFVQLGHGVHSHRLQGTVLDTTSQFAARLSSDRAATHQLLQRMRFPQPVQYLARTVDEAIRAAELIGFPVVVKPCHGRRGEGTGVGLTDTQEVLQAYAAAAQGGDSVLVEALVPGDDHRLLVVGGKLVAAVRRFPAQVVGDGRSTVRELVAALNWESHSLAEAIELDDEAAELLARQGLTDQSVPGPAQRVPLRRTASAARGGTAEDVTERVHPDNARLAEEVATVVGLDVAGIDWVSPDIGRSWRAGSGGIVDVSAGPDLQPHWIADGTPRDVVGPILDLMFPPGSATRVPTVAVTGSIGKTTTCRMVAHILATTGRRVGLATTQGIFVDGLPMQGGDCADGLAAASLLFHPRVEAGVFELARGGLIKTGMVIDRCSVAAVLNVLDNHLGLDGLRSREDLARVKRLIAERADEMVVLNADDPLCCAMREQVRARRLCLVSRRPEAPVVKAHRAGGGCAVLIAGDGPAARIELVEGDRLHGSLPVTRIPATLDGIAMGKAVNAAFGIAIAHGLGVPFSATAAAMAAFTSTVDTNPGRLNLLHHLPYTVLLDWPDGPEATAELAAVARRLPANGKRLLLLTAVGNRPDDFIVAAGRSVAGSFDLYLCSNYTDLRGRDPDAVPRLLAEGLLSTGVAAENIRCIPDFTQALDQAMAAATAGDLLTVATYAVDAALARLRPAST